jgi:phytol kinase
MLNILISLAAIFIVLVISELLWRQKKLSDELTRKTVHVSVAVFVAFWPYYMSYKQIQLVAIAFLVGIIVSRYLHIFRGILHVKRKTFGDMFFPLSILIIAILEPANLVFTIALLHIGLSDGIAALVGKRLGKKNQYKIFGQIKSVAGTLTFIAISLIILVSAKLLNPNEAIGLSWINVIIMPPILAFVENVSAFGADDLTIPLVLLAGLRWF